MLLLIKAHIRNVATARHGKRRLQEANEPNKTPTKVEAGVECRHSLYKIFYRVSPCFDLGKFSCFVKSFTMDLSPDGFWKTGLLLPSQALQALSNSFNTQSKQWLCLRWLITCDVSMIVLFFFLQNFQQLLHTASGLSFFATLRQLQSTAFMISVYC